MSLILSGMVNICQFVAGVPVFLYLDKMGRRKLAIIGGIAMGIPHMIMAGIVGKYNDKWEANPGMGWLGVALICMRFRGTCVFPSPANRGSRHLRPGLRLFVRTSRLDSSRRSIP